MSLILILFGCIGILTAYFPSGMLIEKEFTIFIKSFCNFVFSNISSLDNIFILALLKIILSKV